MSRSRAARLSICPRQDFWASEGSAQGWLPTSDPERREAWVRKCATTLQAVFGTAIHEAARAIAISLRGGGRPPRFEELDALVRGRLRTLWRAKDVAAFRRDPRRDGMLLDRLDGREPDVAAVLTIQMRLESTLRRLIAHPVWSHVRLCGRGDILATDSLDAMLVELAGVLTKVYAAPDLVYLAGAPLELPVLAVPVPAGTPIIVDWKTGRGGGSVTDAIDQLGIYAWYSVTHLGIRPGPLGIVGRVADLSSPDGDEVGGQVVLLSDADLSRGRQLLERAVREVRAFTSSTTGRMEKERTPTVVGAHCRWCPFSQLCDAVAH